MGVIVLNTPIVSIVVPVYNGSNYIDSFFSCLNKQSFNNFEVIIVDDGSNDDTYEKISVYADKDHRIRLLRKENEGPGSARNFGIEKAFGKYIVFFDIDDQFECDILKDNVQIAEKDNADLVMWNFTMVVLGSNQSYYRKIGKSLTVEEEDFFREYLIPTLDNEMFNPPWNKLIKRDMLIVNNIRFHTEYSLYEDILFSYEICSKTKRFALNDKSYYIYMIKSEGSLLTSFHPECFNAISSIYKAALKYGSRHENNSRQIARFKKQFIYLTKGYIKQICINRKLSFSDKIKALSIIGSDNEFRNISKEYDKGLRRIPAKLMMRYRMYRCIICYYNAIDFIKKKVLKKQ